MEIEQNIIRARAGVKKKRSRAHYSEMKIQIWHDLILAPDFMPFLFVCKINGDPVKRKIMPATSSIFDGMSIK